MRTIGLGLENLLKCFPRMGKFIVRPQECYNSPSVANLNPYWEEVDMWRVGIYL